MSGNSREILLLIMNYKVHLFHFLGISHYVVTFQFQIPICNTLLSNWNFPLCKPGNSYLLFRSSLTAACLDDQNFQFQWRHRAEIPAQILQPSAFPLFSASIHPHTNKYRVEGKRTSSRYRRISGQPWHGASLSPCPLCLEDTSSLLLWSTFGLSDDTMMNICNRIQQLWNFYEVTEISMRNSFT